METPIINPGVHDVLLGRGGFTNSHDGNINFRKLVCEHKKRYLDVSKSDKPKVAREVVQIWRKMNPPGRFLARRDDKKGSGSTSTENINSAVWYDVGDKKAREKASQCLRERTRDVLPYVQKLREEQDNLQKESEEMLQFEPTSQASARVQAQHVAAQQAAVAAQMGLLAPENLQQQQQLMMMAGWGSAMPVANMTHPAYQYPDPAVQHQQQHLPANGFVNNYQNHTAVQQVHAANILYNRIPESQRAANQAQAQPQVRPQAQVPIPSQNLSRSSSLSSINCSDLGVEEERLDLDLAPLVIADTEVSNADANTNQNADQVQPQHTKSASETQLKAQAQPQISQPCAPQADQDEDYAELTTYDYEKKLEEWSKAQQYQPEKVTSNNQQAIIQGQGNTDNKAAKVDNNTVDIAHEELTLDEYQRTLEAYLTNNQIMVSNLEQDDDEASLDSDEEGSEYEEELLLDEVPMDATVTSSADIKKPKRRKQRKRITRNRGDGPARGVSRNKSKDSVVSMMSMISMKSGISAMSFNTFCVDMQDNVSTSANNSNSNISCSREMKMKASAKNSGSTRSILSELSDISHAMDDMTLGEISTGF